MTPGEYEEVVRDIVAAIYERVEGITGNVQSGATNRWLGASGQPHQIDVSVQGAADVLLVECKHWSETISLDHVLVMYGRVADIGGCEVRKIHPIVVTTIGYQPGAETVARHFGIDLRVAKSAQEFAIAYKNHLVAGVPGVEAKTAVGSMTPIVTIGGDKSV